MTRPVRLLAPAASLADAHELVAAGADELYCGALPSTWSAAYGQGDLLNRRQGPLANVTELDELRAIAAFGRAAGVPVALALNGRYTRAQLPPVLALAEFWADAGGPAVIVTDPGLLLAVRQWQPTLACHLSSLAGVFNSAAAHFFAAFGIARLVLPRDLSLDEIAAVLADGPPLVYEAIVMHQKCWFQDGCCGFHHDVAIPSAVPAAFAYEPGEPATVLVDDPDYEGHGCLLPHRGPDGALSQRQPDDPDRPHCGACGVRRLVAAGVSHLKLAGRGYPAWTIARAVGFLRAVLAADEPPVAVRARYRATFGTDCAAEGCYWPEVRHG